MIVVLTTPRHGDTLKSMADGSFGAPVPTVRTVAYDKVIGARWLPRATFVFADLERLASWELREAAALHDSLIAAGLRCLNDPAAAMTRVELLANLQARAGNPIGVHRADMLPRPGRFPVFLRAEDDHRTPPQRLYASQPELDGELARLRQSGSPLRGLLVIEKIDAPYAPGLWAKWGSWRIGDRVIVEHIAVDDRWLVKYGRPACLTEAITADELDAVTTNRFAEALWPAFEIGGIAFGRADHAVVDGRTAIFEINTNPYIGRYSPDPWPLRREAQLLARRKLGEALQAIDTPTSIRPVRVDPARRGWRPFVRSWCGP